MRRRDPKAREIIHFLDEMEAIKIIMPKLSLDILESHLHDVDAEIEIALKANLGEMVKVIFIHRLMGFKKMFEDEIANRKSKVDE